MPYFNAGEIVSEVHLVLSEWGVCVLIPYAPSSNF